MKILLVANTLPPEDLSGAGEQVVQLAYGLRKSGHEVRVLGRGEHGPRRSKTWFPLTVLWPLLAELGAFDPDVVQVHESDGGVACLLLRPWAAGRRRRILSALLQVSYVEERRAVRPLRDRGGAGQPVVAVPTASERRFRRWRTPVQIALGWLTARLCRVVFAPSVQTGLELQRDYGARSPRVLPNVTGAPLELGGSDSPTAGGDPYFLYVGRLRIRKGVEILFHALARLQCSGLAVRLLVAGDGEREDELRALASELRLSGVELLGRCSPARIHGLLAGARALVVPSIYEGMPLVILEAMAEGVPVVASSVSGIPEVIEDPKGGWLVPPEDSLQLAETLARVWQDEPEASRRGQAGRERLDLLYQPQRAAALWLEAIEQARDNGRHPIGS